MFSDFKSELKLFLIVAVVSVVLAVGGVWLLSQLQIDSCLDIGGRWDYEFSRCITSETSHTQNEEAANNQQPTIDTRNWQTYRSDGFGFEVRYPQDWEITRSQSEKGISLHAKSLMDLEFSILESVHNNSGTLDEYVEVLREETNAQLEPIIMNGSRGYTLQTEKPQFGTVYIPIEIYLLDPKNKFWSLTGYVDLDEYRNIDADIELLNQILATFRFVEE